MVQASPIRVLLVEDHTIVREGLRVLLQAHSDVQIVGEAADGDEAVAKADELKPSAIVMDINMPKMDGVTATRLIKQSHPQIAVVGLSYMRGGPHVEALRRAGAFDVLSKDHSADDLYGAIQRALTSSK